MTQKIRSDFFHYILALKKRRLTGYFAMESDDKKQQEALWETNNTASRKIFAIEDAFAAAIGTDATKELEHIRKLGFFSFSNRGDRAPEGSTYNMEGELVAVKKGAKK